MGTDSNIDWTTHSWNPWQGCHRTKSPGCSRCYMHAEKKRYGQNPDVVVRSKPPTFNAPLKKWHEPARVFACSWSDFFIEEADAWREEAWDIIRRTRHLTYQILTKRAHRIAECLPSDWGDGWAHVMLGASASTQADLERVTRDLLATPAAVRFLSLEPLLEGVDLESAWTACPITDGRRNPLVDWVIIGCESGPKRRPCKLEWVRSIVEQCKAAGVSVFCKQLDLDGRVSKDMDEWPEWARVREFPEGVDDGR